MDLSLGLTWAFVSLSVCQWKGFVTNIQSNHTGSSKCYQNFEISLPKDKHMHGEWVHLSEVESLGRENFNLPTDKFMKLTSDLHLLLSVLIYEQRIPEFREISDTFPTQIHMGTFFVHIGARDDLEASLHPRFVREYRESIPAPNTLLNLIHSNEPEPEIRKFLVVFNFISGTYILICSRNFCEIS